MNVISSRLKLSILFAVLLYPVLAVAAGEDDSSLFAVPSNYIIQSRDIFTIKIFQEPDLLSEVRVAKDGTVILPLIGKVSVGGMSVQETQSLIRELYNKDYLVEPHVSLMMVSYTERRIHVHGQVNAPGPVIIPPEEKMTMSQVISAAGGLTRLADGGDIRLKRIDENGHATVVVVDFAEILRYPEAGDVEILEGDNVFVTERIF